MKWCIVVVVVSVLSCSQGQDFGKWCPNLGQDLTGCIKQHLNELQDLGRQFTDPSKVLNVQSLLTTAMSTICQPATLTVLDNFYGCIYGKMWACIPSEWKNAFPDVDKAKGALRFMCDNRDDLDLPCVTKTENVMKLATCLQEGTPQPSDLSTAEAYLTYKCSMTPKYNPCTDAAYGKCPKKTAEVMKESYKYSTPVGCDSCVSKPSIILLITFLITAFVNRNVF